MNKARQRHSKSPEVFLSKFEWSQSIQIQIAYSFYGIFETVPECYIINMLYIKKHSLKWN